VLAFVGLISAAAFWPGMAGAAGDARWTALYVALPASLCFVELRPNRMYWLGAAFLALASLSLFWTTVPLDGIAAMMQLMVLACAFLLAHSYEDARPFYSWAGLGLWVSSGIAILQALGYEPVIKAWTNHDTGLFVNQNIMGECAAVVFVALVADRTWWIALGVLPALVLSDCRAAWLAVLCCLIFAGWQRWPKLQPILLLSPALAGIVVYTHRGFGSLWERVEMWKDTAAGLTWFGHGIGSYYSTFGAHASIIDTSSYQVWHAHNDLLELAFELGIPGVALAFTFGALIFWQAAERERVVLIALGVVSFLAFPFHDPATVAIFGIMAGHVARHWDIVRDRQLRGGPALYGRRKRFALGRTRDSGTFIPVQSRLSVWSGAAGDPRA
jgi:hypothetical protein